MLILLLLLSTTAFASESTIVLQDNTTIKTVHSYGKLQFEVEVVEPELKDPSGDAECFDNAKKQSNRRDRYALIERCLG